MGRRYLAVATALACPLAGCATQTYTVKTLPPEAEIALVSEKEIDKPTKTMGKGEAVLKGDDLSGKVYLVRGQGLQRLVLVFPKPNEDGTLTLTVPQADIALQSRISELETQLTAERRMASELKASVDKKAKAQHDIARLLALGQRHLTAGAVAEAERVIAELFGQPEEFLPAHAFTLRGKLRLSQGKRAEARADFMKALGLSEKEAEAKALVESAR